MVVAATLRRLGLRALVRAKKEQLLETVGEHQYGVGRKAGAQLLAKKLRVQSELRPEAVFLKVDLGSAFQRLERGPALAATAAVVPDLAPALLAWYGSRTTHLWKNSAGEYRELACTRGFDQGCPLAAATFSIAQWSVLQPWLAKVRQLDPDTKLYSYLDDTYVVADKRFAATALRELEQALAPLGLVLNPSKTQVWSPTGAQNLPSELLRFWCPALPVLGRHLRTQGDQTDAPVHLELQSRVHWEAPLPGFRNFGSGLRAC